MIRLTLAALFTSCLFFSQGFAQTVTPPTPVPQPNPNDLSNSIDNTTDQVVNTASSLVGAYYGNSFNNGSGYRRPNSVEWLLANAHSERTNWETKRIALSFLIERAAADAKIQLLQEKAKADVMQAKADLELAKTLLRSRKATQSQEVKKAFLEMEIKVTELNSKLAILNRLAKKESIDRQETTVLKSLENCMQRPLRRDLAVQGKSIDAYFAILQRAELYGSVCSSRAGHFFNDQEFSQFKYQLAIAPASYNDGGTDLGKFLTPLLQLNPAASEALSDFPIKTRLPFLSAISEINSEISAFYRTSPENTELREISVGLLRAKTVRLSELLRTFIATQLVQTLNEFDATIEKLADVNPEQASLKLLQKTKFETAVRDLEFYTSSFQDEVTKLSSVSALLCSTLEITTTGEQALWRKRRDLIVPCETLRHPQITGLNKPSGLAGFGRLRLCPSRDLLTENILLGEINTVNDRCFTVSQEGTSNYLVNAVYNKMCNFYHNLEGCAETEKLKTLPNRENFFE